MSKVKHYLSKIKSMDKNTILVCVAVVGILIVGGLIYANSGAGFSMPSFFGLSDQKVAQKAIDYINNNQLSQTPASLVGKATEASGLVKFTIKIGTSSFTSYATKDGKLLFPQVFTMTTTKTTAAAANNTAAANSGSQPAAAVTKTASPSLEAFVVSSCPFGLQMQRAITAAVKAIPALAQYVKVEYIGSVNGTTLSSMHGPEEGAENLRQICIRDEQPTKYYSYLSCYMQKTVATAASGMPLGDSTTCQTTAGVDTTKLNACVSDPSRGLADAQKDFDQDTKYGVSGSPTLVLNGATISENNYGGRSADGVKSMICAGFKTQPSFCSQKLDTTQANTSFSLTYAATSGNTASNTNCNTTAQ